MNILCVDFFSLWTVLPGQDWEAISHFSFFFLPSSVHVSHTIPALPTKKTEDSSSLKRHTKAMGMSLEEIKKQ